METQALFSTPEREKLVKWILNYPSEKLSVRHVSREAKVSPATASRIISLMKKEKWVINNSLNLSNPLVRLQRVYQNISKLQFIFPIKNLNCIGAGIYGSWADGTNVEDSDLDMWILVSEKSAESRIAELQFQIAEKLKCEVNLLVLDKKKLQNIKLKDSVFYYTLVKSLLLWGESLAWI